MIIAHNLAIPFFPQQMNWTLFLAVRSNELQAMSTSSLSYKPGLRWLRWGKIAKGVESLIVAREKEFWPGNNWEEAANESEWQRKIDRRANENSCETHRPSQNKNHWKRPQFNEILTGTPIYRYMCNSTKYYNLLRLVFLFFYFFFILFKSLFSSLACFVANTSRLAD